MRKIVFWIILSLIFPYEINAFASMNVSAEAAIVIENTSGKVLYEKNAYKKMPMASTTKIMTALCVLENMHPAQPVVIDKRSAGIEGSSIYLKEGEMLTVIELLYGMLLNSGNDAATALALAVSDSVEKFAVLMTETAKKIGAQNTNFTNPSGLYEENHYTTAYDLALITAYAMKNEQFAEIVATKKKNISGASEGETRYLSNHNKLLSSYDGCIGVKTGYTKKCGRCLVSCASRDSVTLTCVTLNAPDDWNDHAQLLNYGFSRTVSKQLAAQGDYAMQVEVEGASCELTFKESLHAPVFDGETGETKIVYETNQAISLPVNAGQSVGKALVYSGEALVDNSELICASAVVLPEKRRRFADVLYAVLKKYLNV